jgi:hypothetical protein
VQLQTCLYIYQYIRQPIPVGARTEEWIRGRSLDGNAVAKPEGRGCLSLEVVVYCQVEVSAIGQSLVRRSPTYCGASGCDSGNSTISKPTMDCRTMKKKDIPSLCIVAGSGVPRNFVLGGGGSTNSAEDRENGDLGAVAP